MAGQEDGMNCAAVRRWRRWRAAHRLAASPTAESPRTALALHWSFDLPTVNAVEFQGVSKSYAIYDAPGDRLKELLTLNRVKRHRDFWALHDVSFQVKRGETFCIVGENGSGKSTLLQIVAGILHPTSGTVGIDGRVSALLELGAGFNPEFSGRDNVYLNGSILGLTTRQIDQRYNDIAAFAEIGSFLDQPVKTYSSGMVVRLAFAVAINVDPEILLVDEALAVGDIYFRQRCMRKVHELRQRGITILFVSHAVSDVKAIGDRVLWLDHGRMVDVGEPDRVVSKYLAAMTEKDSAYLLQKSAVDAQPRRGGPVQAPEIVETIPNIDHRFGDGRAEIMGIAVLDEQGRNLPILEPSSRIVVRISVRATADVALPIVGFMLRNQLGMDFSGTNTAREGYELAALQAGDITTVDFYLELPELYPASFSFSPAIADGTLMGYQMCDWIDNAITLQMGRSEAQIYGYVHLPCRVEVNGRIRTERPLESHLG
jgi:ABC-type polysaccharide/polyol phosphate transport system ATPase subunit